MLAFALAAAIVAQQGSAPVKTFYDFVMTSIDGKPVSMRKYRGKAALVVNVASRCGLTPQYKGLEALYKQYQTKGLVVLGFPANDFAGQEPGTNEEIKVFCTGQYQVTFPMFAKISVLGKEAHPLYKFLIEQSGRQEPIEWNFAKFLVGRDGTVLARFKPQVAPDSPELRGAIEKALAQR